MVDVGGGRMRLAISRQGQWEQDAPPSTGWHHIDEPPGGPDANPLTMARDPQGRLWLGYAFNRLVMEAADGSRRQWGASDGLQVGSLLSLAPQDGRLWLGGELGLAAIEDGRVHPIRIAGREPLAGVSGIVADSGGNLWLNTASGIVRLPIAELLQALADPAKAVVAERFDFHDGLDGAPAQLRPVPTAVAADDGKLWFATNNNVVWIDPAHIERNALAPPVQILALSTNGHSWPPTSTTLPAGTREVDLRFTAGSLAQPERVHFRSELEGIDSTWQDVGQQRSAHYTNLAPGRYVFRVMAANEDGLWSKQPASMAFIVPPTFSQTWWFRAMWIPLAGVLAWLLMRWRLRQLAQRYAERHEAILIERERIARELHDTLLQSVQGLILRFQSSVDRMPAHDATRATLERSLDRAEQVLAEGRDRVTDLRAPMREDATLGELLERIGEDLATEHGPAFSATLRGEGAQLPDRVFDEAHHIGAEALANAYRHADARYVHLLLQQTPSRLVLQIVDDGRGLLPTQEFTAGRTGHWGIAGMRERARAIGGRFTLTSTQGEGTRIRLDVRLRGGWLARGSRWLRRIVASIRQPGRT
jgi:signal transduction histidine kinase